jgi:hypothetical protein
MGSTRLGGTEDYTWYSYKERLSGVFILPHWSILVQLPSEIKISDQAWDNDYNEGWIRPAKQDEIELFCQVLHSDQNVFEYLFDLIFGMEDKYKGKRVIYTRH